MDRRQSCGHIPLSILEEETSQVPSKRIFRRDKAERRNSGHVLNSPTNNPENFVRNVYYDLYNSDRGDTR